MFGLRLSGRAGIIGGGILLIAGVLLSVVYLWSPHATLRMTTGLLGPAGQRALSSFVAMASAAHPRVRFELVSVANLVESAKAMEDGKVDLAIVRTDVSPPTNGQTIAILRRDVFAIVLPANSPIKDVPQLADKVIAMPEGPLQVYNSSALDTILSYYNVAPTTVKRVVLPLSQIGNAIHRKQVDAALAVGPIGPGEAVDVVAAVAKATKGAPELLAIEEAEAIAQRFPSFESIDIPDGAFKGHPQIPSEKITGLAVSYRFVAPVRMLDVVAGIIGRSLFRNKAKLTAVSPLASHIEAPDPDDKNPILPVHPGVAAYLNSGDQSIFEALEQYLYVIGIPLSFAGSMLAVLLGLFRNRRLEEAQKQVYRVLVIADAARTADGPELENLEGEFHAIVASFVNKLAEGDSDANQLPVSSLAIDHARRAIERRRRRLETSRAHAAADAGAGGQGE